MKKLIISFLALVFGGNCFAQMSTVRGFAETKSEEICLYRLDNGRPILYARSPVAGTGEFGFIIPVATEGFYAIGFEGRGVFRLPLYLKPKDNAEVVIVYTPDTHSIKFTKNNTPENKTLGEWLTMSEEVRNKSLYTMRGPGRESTYKDFYPALEALLTQTEKFKKSIRTHNARFDRIMRELVDFNTEYYALYYDRTARMEWPPEGYGKPEFYNTMVRPGRFADDLVLETLEGGDYLSIYVSTAAGYSASAEEKNRFMATDRLRGVYYLPLVKGARDYPGYLLLMEAYGGYFTDAQRKEAEEVGAKLYEKVGDGIAADFTYPDIDGNPVSLSDFVGKVVVVDVWATWCQPCRMQLPFLRELEKEYTDRNDIVFIGVSVDVRKDHQKWVDMVRDEELPGIHLFADGWSKIAKDYQIKGVPRFMVFGKDGKVVSADAPRPSQPELKQMIEKVLAK